MKLGSKAHKELFCRRFLETHLTYEPEALPWPELDDVSLAKLKAIPFWGMALKTEKQAGLMVEAYAKTIDDPLVREAVALQAYEEARHGRLLEYMIGHYGIELTEEMMPGIPNNVTQAFTDFGFNECLDSFCAFGMYDLAHQAQYLPEPIFEIFNPLLNEEARHIVFFVNWITYRQITEGRGFPLLRAAHALWFYGRALIELLGAFNSAADGSGEGFTAMGVTTFMDELTLEKFLTTTLQENASRMSVYDAQLLQPLLLPRLAKFVLGMIRLWPGRRTQGNHRVSPSKL